MEHSKPKPERPIKPQPAEKPVQKKVNDIDFTPTSSMPSWSIGFFATVTCSATVESDTT